MTPRKLHVQVAFFSYGGNGGFRSENPDVRDWLVDTAIKAYRDERISQFSHFDIADTPITMTRNRAVKQARLTGADVLIMVDSDMRPDCELSHDPTARPFFESSFDYLYKHYETGPVVIGAPYCGPPPMSNMYVFRWASWNNPGDVDCPDWRIEAYSREESASMMGMHEAAALPTGLIMFDMRAFDLVKPPYFYYEWKDDEQTEKGSTEDVTATRDISMHGQLKLGYNPVICNWDAWAGHHKPLCVEKPRVIYVDHVGEKYKQAVLENKKSNLKTMKVDFFAPNEKRNGQVQAIQAD